MKHRWLLISVAIFAVLLLVTSAVSAMGLLELPRWTTDSGGGSSSGLDYSLMGAIGQPDTGHAQGGGYQLSGGFWVGAGGMQIGYQSMLPILVRP